MTTVTSQINFERGYIVENNGNKREVLIKNIDWKENPNSVQYRDSENSNVISSNIKSIKEFGIYGESKFTRHTVDIDYSSDNPNDLTENKNPVFEENQIFLKHLVEGKASLYFFEGKGVRRFFYSLESNEPVQLIYKRYLKPKFRIGVNNRFRKQLYTDFSCNINSTSKIKKIDYRKKDLINFFKNYNECVNSESLIFAKEKAPLNFNFYVRPGINFSSLEIYNVSRFVTINFENQANIRLGIETELILPFNKNKWAIIAEPSYHSYSAEKEVDNIYRNAKVNFNYIEVPIGVRYYLFLNENFKIFGNVVHVIDFNLDSTIDFETGIDLELSKRNKWAVGLGLNYNSKFSIEARYQLDSNVLGDYNIWGSEFRTSSLVIGYRFL